MRARNLLAADPNGKSDPYCVLSVDGGGTECQTKMCLATLEPEWKQSFTFMIAPPQGVALGYDNQEVFGSYLKVTSCMSDVWLHCCTNMVVPSVCIRRGTVLCQWDYITNLV